MGFFGRIAQAISSSAQAIGKAVQGTVQTVISAITGTLPQPEEKPEKPEKEKRQVRRPARKRQPEPEPRIQKSSKVQKDSQGRIIYRPAQKKYFKPYNYVVRIKAGKDEQVVTVTSRRQLTEKEVFDKVDTFIKDPKYEESQIDEIMLEDAFWNEEAVLQ